ncbi:Methionyl-tRNA formyltransferase [Coemansia sp. Benny D160-2]|nr:Methionyl-tRNA formyltransferase [Coemansia sp. Benny D160-2]
MTSLLVCTRLAAPATRRVGISMLRTPKPWHRISINSLTAATCGGIQSIYSKRFNTTESGDEASKKQARPLTILFFGTDMFAKFALKELYKARKEESAAVGDIDVVCPAPIRKKRGLREKVVWAAESEKEARKQKRLVIHTSPDFPHSWGVPNHSGTEQTGPAYDIGVVASFGKFIPQSIIGRFPLGMVNLHPSLLPKYRGATPIQTAILNGDAESGVTVQELHPRVMDGGRVLAQAPFALDDTIHRVDAMRQMGVAGGQLLVKVLENLERMRAGAAEQDEAAVTQTRLIRKSDAQIYWDTMSAAQIMRLHRAYFEQEPVYSFFRMKSKIKHTQFIELRAVNPAVPPIDKTYLDHPPGTMFFARKVPYIEIVCIDGNRLHATRFVVSGKAETDQYQFTAGYLRYKKAPAYPRFLSTLPDLNRPTPEYVFPPDYKRPEMPEFDMSIKIVKN